MPWWVCAYPIPKLSVMVAGKRSRDLAEQLFLQWMIGLLLILRKLFLTTLHSQVLQIKPTLCLPTLPCFYPTTSVLLLTRVWYFWQSHMKLMGFIAYIALCFVGETCLNLKKKVIVCIPIGSQCKKHNFAWSDASGIQYLKARLIACTWQEEQSKIDCKYIKSTSTPRI